MSVLIIYVVQTKLHDVHYLLDSLRWIQLAKKRGIRAEDIYLCGLISQDEKSLLSYMTILKHHGVEDFSLDEDNIHEYLNVHMIVGRESFFELFNRVHSDVNVECITLLLIDHGRVDGTFGSVSEEYSLSDDFLYELLSPTTKPILLICSACYSIPFMHKLAGCANVCRLYDTSKDFGLTRNWSLNILGIDDLGTYLLYMLFDIYYGWETSYEIAMAVQSIKNIPYPNPDENSCTLHFEGSLTLFSRTNFMGTSKPQGLSQPQFPVPSLYNPSSEIGTYKFVHPTLGDEIDEFLKTQTVTNFWDCVYDEDIMREIVCDPELFGRSKIVSRLLVQLGWINSTYMGAGIPYAMTKLNLDTTFIPFVQERNIHK